MRKNVILTVIALMMSLSSVMAQDKVYQLSSHILDINTGRPAQGVKIVLSKLSGENNWSVMEERTTDGNGRVKDFLEKRTGADNRGVYKLTLLRCPVFRVAGTRHFLSIYRRGVRDKGR